MKNKLILLIISSCLIHSALLAQDYQWEWARSINPGEGLNDPLIISDWESNVYVALSYFGAELAIGDFTLQNANALDQDIALVKYNANGDIVWAKGFGAAGTDRLLSASADSDGNIIFSGATNSSSLSLDNYSITPVGGYDSFIAKMDGDGNILWAKPIGSASNDFVRPLALDAANNIYATGYFYGASITIDDVTINNTGSADMFLLKMNPDAEAQWALTVAGDAFSLELPTSLDVSPSGQCLLSATYSAEITIGSFVLQTAGGNDTFMMLTDAAGNVQWAESLSTADYESITDVKFFDEDSFYCAGWYEGLSFQIGDVVINNTFDTGSAVFLASFQTDGSVNWAIGTNGNDFDNIAQLAVSGDNVYVAIGFESSTISLDEFSFNNAGNEDLLYAVVNSNGDVTWADAIGSEGYDFSSRIVSGGGDDVFVCGTYNSDVLSFGEHDLNNDSEFAAYLYVAKLSEAALSVNAFDAESAINIFPNPCNNELILATHDLSGAYAEIVDAQGSLLTSFFVGNSKSPIRLCTEKYPAGVYALSLRFVDGRQVTSRFVIQH